MRALCLVASITLLIAGCGGGGDEPTPPATPPVSGQTGDEVPASGPPLGFPVFATKNTTRIAGGDAIADAAAVALATYPARTPESRPQAVVLAHDTFAQGSESGYNVGPHRAVTEFAAARGLAVRSTILGLPGMSLLSWPQPAPPSGL